MLVGNRLKELRESKELSQGDIEKRTGLLRCYISRVENGHTVLAIETLEKMARALEVPMYRLFHDGEVPEGLSKPKPLKHDWPASAISAGNARLSPHVGLRKNHAAVRFEEIGPRENFPDYVCSSLKRHKLQTASMQLISLPLVSMGWLQHRLVFNSRCTSPEFADFLANPHALHKRLQGKVNTTCVRES